MNNNISKLRDKIKQADLLNRATLIEVDYGIDVNRYNQVDLLCKTMTNAARTEPVKAEYEGRMFAVDKGATLEETFQAWKEQTWKPFVAEKFKPEPLKRILNMASKEPDLGITSRAYMDAGAAEVLVTQYPEHAKDLSMLHLLNAFGKSEEKNAPSIANVLKQSAERFANGEETFPITLKSMTELDKHKDELFFAVGKDVNVSKLKKRIHESELKMLKELEPDDLCWETVSVLQAGMKIAEKHKDSSDFRKMFSQEINNKIHKDKTSSHNTI